MIISRDRKGRTIDYLRIAVTDRENLLRIHGVPAEPLCVPEQALLTRGEIEEIGKTAAACGISHIKLTGGEPLLREDFSSIVRLLKSVEGIETVTLTTNGILLPDCFADLKNAGIDGINIDLDTLNRKRYEELTGVDALEQVVRAVELCLFGGIRTKLNVTVSRTSDAADLLRLAELAKTRPLDVRFVELLPIGYGKNIEPMDNYQLLRLLREKYPGMALEKKPEPVNGHRVYTHGMGPAVYYQIPDFKGSIGFISALHDKFCDGCNRLRVTCTGRLKYCLCYEDGVELAPLLRGGLTKAARQKQLREAFATALRMKPDGHPFTPPKKKAVRQAAGAV